MLPNTARTARTAALAGLFCATLAAGAARADLSGKWMLDEEHSDDPATQVQKADRSGTIGRVARNTSGTVVVFGIPIPVARSGEASRDDKSIDSAALVRSGYLLSVIDELTIRLDRAFVDFAYDTLRTQTYENGVEANTGYSTIVAEWSDDRIVIEHALIGGGEISETYELDGSRLRWDVRVKKKGHKTIRLERVYDRAGTSNASALNFRATR